MNAPIPKLNPDIRPPGGFKFKDGDSVVHIGTSLAGLIKAVVGYRQRIGHAPGNPEAEVTMQICTKYPRLCKGLVPSHNEATLVSQVALRARDSLQAKIDFSATPAPLAHERARICGTCRYRLNWAAKCKPCEKKIGEVIEHVLDGVTGKLPAMRGEACLLAQTDLQIATINPHNRTPLDAPEHCWMGKDNVQ